MAKRTYIGVNGIARRVQKMYIGVNGVARKVRKAYIGVADIARLFFKYGELVYHPNYASRITGNADESAAANNAYAFVSNGTDVNAFDKELVCSLAANLSSDRPTCKAAPVGQYAVFGASDYNYEERPMDVDAYDESATRTSATPFPSSSYAYRAIYNDSYAIFGPGAEYNTGSGINKLMKLYDSTLTLTTTNAPSDHRIHYCVSTNGTYAILYGGAAPAGYGSDKYYAETYVSAIDTSGTATALTEISGSGTEWAIGVRAGDYALCAGGDYRTSDSNVTSLKTVVTYDQSLTKSNASSLSYYTPYQNVVSSIKEGASAGEYGIIPTDNKGASSPTADGFYYEAYDGSLVRQLFNRGSDVYTSASRATSFGDMALFYIGKFTDSVGVDVFAVE